MLVDLLLSMFIIKNLKVVLLRVFLFIIFCTSVFHGVHNSVHKNYYFLHRKFCNMKKKYLN